MNLRAIFTHLRISVMVAFALIWNSMLLFGMWLGGGQLHDSAPSRAISIAALVGAAVFAVSLAQFERLQQWWLRSRQDIPRLKRELWYVAGVCTFIAIIFAWA